MYNFAYSIYVSVLIYFSFSSLEDVDYAEFGYDFVQRSNQVGPLFHNIALQQYILLCAQVSETSNTIPFLICSVLSPEYGLCNAILSFNVVSSSFR
jgi:hypothetical protein